MVCGSERGAPPSPARRRACFDRVLAELNVSERRACRVPRQHGSLFSDGSGVLVQADPGALALSHVLIAARHALEQAVSAAPLHDGHGHFPADGVCGLSGETCCKTGKNDGSHRMV